MKKFKKLAAMTCLAVTVASSAVVFAGVHITNFTFDFHTATNGKTKYNLENKQTSFYTTANTYQDGSLYSKKFDYMVCLYSTSTFGPTYNGSGKTANGKQYQTYFKSVKKGEYKFYLTTTEKITMYGANIKGSGEFWQD